METITMDLLNTAIPSQVSIDALQRYSFNMATANIPTAYTLLFTSIATFLQLRESKDAGKVSLSIHDERGNFKIAGIVSYHAPDEDAKDDERGNWSLEFTLDEKDLREVSVKFDNMNSEYISILNNEFKNSFNGKFKSTTYIPQVFAICIDSLINQLDNLVTEDKAVDIKLNGIFIASGAVEDGQKVISIVPGSVVKQIVKNDSALQV